MIHYDKTLTYKKLAAIKPADPPGAGRNWKAVPHKEAIDAFRAELADHCWAETGPVRYGLSHNQQVMAGVWDVEWDGTTKVKLPKNVTLQLGFQHGNDRHTPLTAYMGARITDKDKGPFSVVLMSQKAPGQNSIRASTTSRMSAAINLLTLDLDDGILPAIDRYLTDKETFAEFDVLENLVRGAEWKLYPWSSIEAGARLWRDKHKTYHATPADITACLWACLAKTNPVTHLKAGMEFNTIIFG